MRHATTALTLVSLALAALLAGCSTPTGGLPPGGGSGGATIAGTLEAASGGDVHGTFLEACAVVSGQCDSTNPDTQSGVVQARGASTTFSFTDLAAGSYQVYACLELTGDDRCDAGDDFGFYTTDGTHPADVTPPASGIDVRLALLGSGGGGGGSGGGGGGGGASGQGMSPDAPVVGRAASVVVGPDGVTHMAYLGGDGSAGTHPVRYGECASACTDPASWTFLTLGDYGSPGLGGGVRLALNPAGHPRVAWFEQQDVGGASGFVYAACDSDCTTAGGWSGSEVIAGDAFTTAMTARSFALDAYGEPHLVFDTGNGITYASCAANCTSAANWGTSVLTALPPAVDLAFDANDHAHAVFEDYDSNVLNGYDLYYGECDASCGQDANWQVTPLVQVANGVTPFALALTPSGTPRVAFYDGSNRLDYAWCDSGCSQSGNWGGATTGLPTYSGHSGVALVVGGDGAPRIAFGGSSSASGGTGDESANLAVCTGGCDSASASWSTTVVERPSDVSTPAPDPCGAGGSYWQLGSEPGLAVDAGGGAHVSYDLYSVYRCQVDTDPYGNPVYTVDTLAAPVRYAEP